MHIPKGTEWNKHTKKVISYFNKSSKCFILNGTEGKNICRDKPYTKASENWSEDTNQEGQENSQGEKALKTGIFKGVPTQQEKVQLWLR